MIENPTAVEILNLNQKLLDSIASGDWAVYESLCSADLTCFEPETLGHLVEGMPFHKFYFDLGPGAGSRNVTMATPHVRLLGDDAAIVAYTRLVQRLDSSGSPVTARVEETRVWQRVERSWKLVHIHRSTPV
jgi:calcium/calmodulin-dependent protein kinase (CaM kinase) II